MLKKLKTAIQEQLSQGVSTLKLSQSLSAGLLIGCFPILGTTTGLAALAGFAFKLNHLVLQASNYLMYPVQIILLPVYIKVIGLITDVGDIPLRPDLMFEAFKSDPMGHLNRVALVSLYAIILWSIVSLILFFILQFLFLPMITKFKKE